MKCEFSMWSHRYASGHLRLIEPFSQTFSGIQSKLSGPGLSGCPVVSGSQTLDPWDLTYTLPSLLFRFPRSNHFIRTRTAEARSGSRGHSHRSAFSQMLDHFIVGQFLKIATSDYNSRITWVNSLTDYYGSAIKWQHSFLCHMKTSRSPKVWWAVRTSSSSDTDF